MAKLILYMFTTVDGFIAGPNGEFDDYCNKNMIPKLGPDRADAA